MSAKCISVYILASISRVLYIGVTGDLRSRTWQHKNKLVEGFTARYKISRLVYFESFSNPNDAIEREKQLKRWSRAKKVQLIESKNQDWRDLAEEWFPKSKARSLGSPD